ncbi:hypothetical protein GOBAR_DD18156 [Gossypium barbadense]|nr:hypothetical protein GOBAR_DD18156 [Gossypium barbadense]
MAKFRVDEMVEMVKSMAPLKAPDLTDMEMVTLEAQSRLDLFGDEQVERILSIPLVNSVQTDEVIWRGDNTRAYTTKSGYKWLITEGENLLGSNNSMQYVVLNTFYTRF